MTRSAPPGWPFPEPTERQLREAARLEAGRSPYREPAGGYDPPTQGFDHWPEREREIHIALSYARNTDRILDRYSGPPGRCERDVLDRAASAVRTRRSAASAEGLADLQNGASGRLTPRGAGATLDP